MLNFKTKTVQLLIFFVIGISLITYIGIRAYRLSFTHDESLSYTIIKGEPLWKDTANNHQINTFLMRVSSIITGDSEFSLRLPNLISFIFFLTFCFYIIRNKNNNILFIIGCILLFFNPFILEFFSIARGYGISLAMMSGSLYFLLRNCSMEQVTYKQFLKDFIPAMAFSFAANFSNLSLINFSISILIIFIARYLYLKIKDNSIKIKENLIFTFLVVICLIFIYISVERLLFLNQLQQLFFGTDTFADTINSLILSTMLKFDDFNGIDYIRYFIIALFIVGTLYVFITKQFKSRLFVISIILILIVSGLFFEYYIFGGKFPKQRAAMYFIPLFCLFIYYFIEIIFDKMKENMKSIALFLFLIIIGIPAIYNFATKVNLKNYSTWDYEAHTKDVIKILEKLSANKAEPGKKHTLSNNWLFEPTLNYYITTRNLNFVKTDRNGISQESDFVYDFTENFNLNGFYVIAVFPDTKTTLYRNLNSR